MIGSGASRALAPRRASRAAGRPPRNARQGRLSGPECVCHFAATARTATDSSSAQAGWLRSVLEVPAGQPMQVHQAIGSRKAGKRGGVSGRGLAAGTGSRRSFPQRPLCSRRPRRPASPARALLAAVGSTWRQSRCARSPTRSRSSRRLALSVVLPGWKRWGLRMRAARVDWEDQRRRKVVKKILPKGESTGRPFAVQGPSWLAVKGAWRVPRASARSGHRTSCWARPGSRRWGTMKRRVTSGSRSVAA